MNRAIASIIIAVAGLAASLPTTAGAQGAANDEQAIKTVITEVINAFNKHDAKGVARLYTPDGQVVTSLGDVLSGQSGIEKDLTALYAGRLKNASQKIHDIAIKFIRPDVAIAHMKSEISGVVAADGKALPTMQQLSLRVLVKDAGNWRVAAFQGTAIPPAAPPASSASSAPPAPPKPPAR